MRPKFIFHPSGVREIGDGGGFQAQRAFVKLAGARHVGDGVTTKRDFGDFEHDRNGMLNFNDRAIQLISEIENMISILPPFLKLHTRQSHPPPRVGLICRSARNGG
jgi:hypothetical protein